MSLADGLTDMLDPDCAPEARLYPVQNMVEAPIGGSNQGRLLVEEELELEWRLQQDAFASLGAAVGGAGAVQNPYRLEAGDPAWRMSLYQEGESEGAVAEEWHESSEGIDASWAREEAGRSVEHGVDQHPRASIHQHKSLSAWERIKEEVSHRYLGLARAKDNPVGSDTGTSPKLGLEQALVPPWQARYQSPEKVAAEEEVRQKFKLCRDDLS
eukprot:gene19494-26157_t